MWYSFLFFAVVCFHLGLFSWTWSYSFRSTYSSGLLLTSFLRILSEMSISPKFLTNSEKNSRWSCVLFYHPYVIPWFSSFRKCCWKISQQFYYCSAEGIAFFPTGCFLSLLFNSLTVISLGVDLRVLYGCFLLFCIYPAWVLLSFINL